MNLPVNGLDQAQTNHASHNSKLFIQANLNFTGYSIINILNIWILSKGIDRICPKYRPIYYDQPSGLLSKYRTIIVIRLYGYTTLSQKLFTFSRKLWAELS